MDVYDLLPVFRICRTAQAADDVVLHMVEVEDYESNLEYAHVQYEDLLPTTVDYNTQDQALVHVVNDSNGRGNAPDANQILYNQATNGSYESRVQIYRNYINWQGACDNWGILHYLCYGAKDDRTLENLRAEVA